MRPPPDYPATPYPFSADGGLAPAARNSAVVSIAIKYLGIPYKWGGAKPKTGFDCSGLVQYVFAQLAVYLPHYAAAQYYSAGATWVAPNQLQPGDLVFFTGSDGTRKSPGHVGIYVGDGYLIDAPHTGSFVHIDSLNEPWFANNYVGAKRIDGVSFDVRHLAHIGPGLQSLSRLSPTSLKLTGQALGESPQLLATVRIGAQSSATRGFDLWTGAGSGGALLLIAGAVTYRRRRCARRANPSRHLKGALRRPI